MLHYMPQPVYQSSGGYSGPGLFEYLEERREKRRYREWRDADYAMRQAERRKAERHKRRMAFWKMVFAALRPRPVPQAAPTLSKAEQAEIAVLALSQRLGRLPKLHEIVAETGIPKTTAWRALSEVRVNKAA